MEEAIILGAKKAIKMLTESGQVGHITETPEPMLAEMTCEITTSVKRFAELISSDSPVNVAGNRNLVIWDGKQYICETKIINNYSEGYVFIGNVKLVSATYGTDTGEPFCIRIKVATGDLWTHGEAGTHTLEIQNLVETVRKVDPKFLPGIDALTLNGADGKQYKLVVDASGALVATPIE